MVRQRVNGNSLPTQNTSSGLGKMLIAVKEVTVKRKKKKKKKRMVLKAGSDPWLISIWPGGEAPRSDLIQGCVNEDAIRYYKHLVAMPWIKR